MEHLLVVGIDTVVGANVAASLSDRYRTSTLDPQGKYDIANCDAVDPADAPEKILADVRPDVVIYCGPASRSAWEPGMRESIQDSLVAEARDWATAAHETGAHFVMISSDAVFTGPWMFHVESSPGLCQSFQSQAIRAAEQQVNDACPAALIIRTNAFGWSVAGGDGWVESLLQEIQSNRVVRQDHIRHATPILATDLANILERACLEVLSGTYHIGGAERVSPLMFAQRLADQFDLPWLSVRKESALSELPQGFSEGECSLQTKAIRMALCVAMPLLSEGLARLQEQAENGYRERLRGHETGSTVRKAA